MVRKWNNKIVKFNKFNAIKQKETPITILTEGFFDSRHAKTAIGVIRYGNWPISSIIDSKFSGKTISDFHKLDSRAPIVKSIEDALEQNPRPKALLIGIAPVGGKLPDSWIEIIKIAIKNKLDIISGLHYFINENEELKNLATANQVNIYDLRDPDLYEASASQSVAKQKTRPIKNKVITLVGSDCNVGKMTVALELSKAANARGVKSSFIATGQTGIMISGQGIPLDRIIGDFMAGSVENLIFETIEKEDPEFIFVEGQGSLLHPGYSGVTLSLIHGSNPDAMILCTKSDNKEILGYDIPVPNYTKLIEIYESAANWIRKDSAKVLGVSLNTSSYDDNQAKDLIKQVEAETKLAANDAVRFGVENIVDQLIKNLK